MSLAVATINGRLVRDPEVKELGTGTVTSFTVACDQYNGKSKDKTPQYWDCECWGPAQAILKYFHKGDPITVSGSLRQDKVDNEKGKRTFYKLRVEEVGTLPARGTSAATLTAEDTDDDPF